MSNMCYSFLRDTTKLLHPTFSWFWYVSLLPCSFTMQLQVIHTAVFSIQCCDHLDLQFIVQLLIWNSSYLQINWQNLIWKTMLGLAPNSISMNFTNNPRHGIKAVLLPLNMRSRQKWIMRIFQNQCCPNLHFGTCCQKMSTTAKQ